MAKPVIIEEFHLTIRVPVGLPQNRIEVIRESLTSETFLRRLRRVIRATVRTDSTLDDVHLTLTR